MEHKHLPHLDLAEYYQFVSFRTADSTDGFLQRLSLQNKANSAKQMEADHYLDSSTKGAYLKGSVLCYLNDFLKYPGNDIYKLIAFSVMPNHVHLLLKPHINLSLMMQKIKGSSAKASMNLWGDAASSGQRIITTKQLEMKTIFQLFINI